MRRLIRWALFGPPLLLLLLTIAAGIGMVVPQPLWGAGEDAALVGTRRILVLSNPIHTDIAIPVDAASLARFPFLAASGLPVDAAGARWILFGWGGRAFYLETPTWADLSPGPLARGLTLDRSVLHVDVTGEIAEPSETVKGFDVGPAAYARLLDFIAASFAGGDGQAMVIAGAQYGLNDRFFEANGWFTALAGCNTWTAKALREAGLRTGLWNPLPASLAVSLKLFN